MSLSQDISDFIRDAQYRIGQITVDGDVHIDRGDLEDEDEITQRDELSAFNFLLWVDRYQIRQGANSTSWPNFIWEGNNAENTGKWTEREIKKELDILRDRTEMASIPWLEYPSYTNIIRQTIAEQSADIDIPTGVTGQIVVYTSANTVAGDSPNNIIGSQNTLINNYFAGR